MHHSLYLRLSSNGDRPTTTATKFIIADDHSHMGADNPTYLCEGGAMSMPGVRNAWKFDTRAEAQEVADQYMRMHVVELPA